MKRRCCTINTVTVPSIDSVQETANIVGASIAPYEFFSVRLFSKSRTSVPRRAIEYFKWTQAESKCNLTSCCSDAGANAGRLVCGGICRNAQPLERTNVVMLNTIIYDIRSPLLRHVGVDANETSRTH